MSRILVFGGAGQLGAQIRSRWSGHEVVAPPHSDVDILDAASVERAIVQYAPDAVVNCAAFHNVDRCEDEPAAAFASNAIAVDAIAALCQARDVRFVTISTDYVFSGDADVPYAEDDAPHPISTYGASKLAGELLVQRRQMDAVIVRTCGVYGVSPSTTKGYTFVDRIIAQARAGEHIRVVDDVIASPTYAGHLADALERLVATGEPGIYHAVNRGAVTWYEFARGALEAAGIEASIEPVPQSTWVTKARRPRFSALSAARIARLGIEMPGWRAGVAAYLSDKTAVREAS